LRSRPPPRVLLACLGLTSLPEHLDSSTSELLDFLSLPFVFIDILGSFVEFSSLGAPATTIRGANRLLACGHGATFAVGSWSFRSSTSRLLNSSTSCPRPLFSWTFSLCSLDFAVDKLRSGHVGKPSASFRPPSPGLWSAHGFPFLGSSTPRLPYPWQRLSLNL